MHVDEFDAMTDIHMASRTAAPEFLEKATAFNDPSALTWIDANFVPIERAVIIVKLVKSRMIADEKLIKLADVYMRACKYFLAGNARTLATFCTIEYPKLVEFCIRKMIHKNT